MTIDMSIFDKYIEQNKEDNEFEEKFVNGTKEQRIAFCLQYLKENNVKSETEKEIEFYQIESPIFKSKPGFNTYTKRDYVNITMFSLTTEVDNRMHGLTNEEMRNTAIALKKQLLNEIGNSEYFVFRTEQRADRYSTMLNAQIGIVIP